MDNKKLLKFLYKDIDEIQDLVTEKGSEGFDEFEIEFIQSRFTGAKQLIQILSEKENKQLKKIRPRPAIIESEEEIVLEPKAEIIAEVKPEAQFSEHEQESLEELSNFEEELKEDEPAETEAKKPAIVVAIEKETQVEEVVKEKLIEEEVVEPVVAEELIEKNVEVEDEVSEESDSSVELNEAEEVDEANHRLGDSFSKDKSVNELLGNDDSQKLEYKISNSPVESIKTAIGINDRYQYIRELFEGNAETFSKAVGELDKLDTIQEAVNYLQQNYSWKKNDTSLKFVNLVKRRFPNG